MCMQNSKQEKVSGRRRKKVNKTISIDKCFRYRIHFKLCMCVQTHSNLWWWKRKKSMKEFWTHHSMIKVSQKWMRMGMSTRRKPCFLRWWKSSNFSSSHTFWWVIWWGCWRIKLLHTEFYVEYKNVIPSFKMQWCEVWSPLM